MRRCSALCAGARLVAGGAAVPALSGAEGRPVVRAMHRSAGEWGVGVAGGRLARLIRRWRGWRASLTPRSAAGRASRVAI